METEGRTHLLAGAHDGTGLSRRSTERGTVLVMVLAIVAAVLVIGAALFMLAAGESDVVEYGVDGSRAFYLAEAGLERARTWLEQLAQTDPPTCPEEGSFVDQTLGGGRYDVRVDKLGGSSPWSTAYEIVSTGDVDGVVRQIRAVIEHETFAQYLYFADRMDDIWFITGDSLDGRLHANGHIRMSGSPWFGMKVTSSKDHFILWQDSEPVFEAGYELGVDEIPLPVTQELVESLASSAASEGLYAGPLPGRRAKYEVVLGRNGALGTLSYRAYRKVGGSYHWTDWTTVDVSSFNGVAWFDEPIRIRGVLDGQLTVGSSGDIYITDDVLYEDSVPGQGPIPGCDDVLGMVSAKNIIVAATGANMHDCEIHAHMMALDKSFTVEMYDQGPPRGDLIIWGGFAQKKQGAVGKFKHGGGIVHGYQKNYHYDRNLLSNSPPGYPPTGKYLVVSWEEVSAPEA